MSGNVFTGLRNRLLAALARNAPGATTLRVQIHRWRGVRIGDGVFIGTDAILETSQPHLIWIGDRVAIGIRDTIIAHFRESAGRKKDAEGQSKPSVRIEDDAFLGPGVIVLPNVTIGHGAVVMAGSVVTKSVLPLTMVVGNPAVPVARCGVPLGLTTPLKEFYQKLKPIQVYAEEK